VSLKILIILSLVTNLFGLNFQSDSIDGQLRETVEGQVTETKFTNILPEISKIPTRLNSNDPVIYANNLILIDSQSNQVLYQEKGQESVPIASTTKIMTAMIAIENYDLNQIATISKKAANQNGSGTNLIYGEEISIINLLKCLLIRSGNDSAYAVAEIYNGEVEDFIDLMNKKAEFLKMEKTFYSDPAGLNPETKSSARDLSIITKYALENEVFSEIVKTGETSVTDVSGIRHHDLKNSNRLVNDYNYPGAIGVKTGYLPEAGHCLVAAAERGGVRLIAVILNTGYDTPEASAIEAKKLLDWGFSSFKYNREL
jgi:D-alanyl-D-alanine carboxypeptidase